MREDTERQADRFQVAGAGIQRYASVPTREDRRLSRRNFCIAVGATLVAGATACYIWGEEVLNYFMYRGLNVDGFIGN